MIVCRLRFQAEFIGRGQVDVNEATVDHRIEEENVLVA
jgi:hypothetical protein